MLKLNTPYPYQELKRKSVDGKRLYENPYGEPVPSVTTILDKTKPKEKISSLKPPECKCITINCTQRYRNYYTCS